MTARRSLAAFVCLLAAAGAIDAPANPSPVPALPFFYDLTEEQQTRVIDEVLEYLAGAAS